MLSIKRLLFVLIPAIVFFIPGCKKTKNGNFQLQVKAVYGSQYFAVSGSQAFPSDTFNIDPANKYIEVNNLQFYLSHMYLVKTDNSLVKVTDVNFFDIGNPSTLTVNLQNIQGDFKGIQFYCGVDSLQDTTIDVLDPNFPPGLELGQGAMYWGMLQYQFENISGKWDISWTDSTSLRNAFLYHVGGYTYLYKPVSINSSFSVCCGSTTTKTLTLDFEKIFYNGSTQILNIGTQGTTMCDSVVATGGSPDALVIARQFTTNFANAFSFQ